MGTDGEVVADTLGTALDSLQIVSQVDPLDLRAQIATPAATNANTQSAGATKCARMSPVAVAFSTNAAFAHMPTAQKNKPAQREKQVVESVLNMAIAFTSLSNTP